MRKNLYTLISLIIFLTVFTGCKTASKLYNKGDYEGAVDLAIKKLQKKPGDTEMIGLLQNAYGYAVKDHIARIRQLDNNTNELKWEWIYNEYASLQHLYEAIHRSPEAVSVIRPTDYSDLLNTYADRAADIRYQRGLVWMEKNDKQSFRNAYNEFNAALNYRPQDIAFLEKRDEAYQNAVINVVVMPLNNSRYSYGSFFNNDLKSFENNLLRLLQNHSGNDFVDFYSSWEANNKNIVPDQFLDFRFSTINVGRAKDQYSTREVSKDVVIKETVYKPDSVVREYKKVFAKITTTKRTMLSDGNLQINIRDAGGRWLWSDNISGDHNWYTEFATFTGDERALSDSDKELVGRRQVYPPRDEEIIECILNEINNNVRSHINNYYSRL